LCKCLELEKRAANGIAPKVPIEDFLRRNKKTKFLYQNEKRSVQNGENRVGAYQDFLAIPPGSRRISHLNRRNGT